MNRSVLLLVSVISLFTVFPARCGDYQDGEADKRVAVLIEKMLKAETEQKHSQTLMRSAHLLTAAILILGNHRSW